MGEVRHTFQAFGLCIESNYPLASTRTQGLGNCKPDLFVWFREDFRGRIPSELGSLWYVSPYLTSDGQPNSTVFRSQVDGKLDFTFVFADGVTIRFRPSTGQIEVFWPPHYTAQDAAIYVTGPVFAFALKLKGMLTLHASAVNVEDSAVLFIGRSGMGKSTIAAAFAKSGFPILTDDLAVLKRSSGSWTVKIGLARLCVWPRTLEVLFGGSDNRFPSISPNDPLWDKRYLELDDLELKSQHAPLPVRAVYLLDRRLSDWAGFQFNSLLPKEALMSLVTHTYGFYWPLHEARAMEFQAFSRFTSQVPVRNMIFPNDLTQLDRLVEQVCRDVIELPQDLGPGKEGA